MTNPVPYQMMAIILILAGSFFAIVGFTPTRTLRRVWWEFKEWLKMASVTLLLGCLVFGYILVWVGIPLLICIALIKLIGGLR